eukprot:g5533.t1
MSYSREKRIIGEWRLERHIGSGSFSDVWKATHRRTQRFAAVKEINKGRITPTFSKCIRAELSFLQRSNHPNIVAFYEKIETGSHLFIIMEFCKDGDLESVMQKGPCDEVFTRQCMVQLAAGLQELRSMGLVHRDLKPPNLLLHDGVLKIADFGFARSLQPEKLADTLCGSPLYMAPEVLQLKKYDARADLWSVGVIMYEMLVGRTPFEGQTYVHLLKNIETTKVRIPKVILKNTSRSCLDLMVRLLQREPNKRIDFESFFKHPFVTKEMTGESSSQPSTSEKTQSLPLNWDTVVQGEASCGEDLAYTSDDEFVIVFRRQNSDSTAKRAALLEESEQLRSRKELEEHLMRVSDCIIDLAEARAYGGLMSDAFYLSTISLQILEYLISNDSTNSVLSLKLKETLKKANEFSTEIENEAEGSCGNLYGLIFDHALACSKGAAGGELVGQYTHAHELYTKSIDLLQFLLNEGYDVNLDNPLRLPKSEKERIHSLISKVDKRKHLCTTNRGL